MLLILNYIKNNCSSYDEDSSWCLEHRDVSIFLEENTSYNLHFNEGGFGSDFNFPKTGNTEIDPRILTLLLEQLENQGLVECFKFINSIILHKVLNDNLSTKTINKVIAKI